MYSTFQASANPSTVDPAAFESVIPLGDPPKPKKRGRPMKARSPSQSSQPPAPIAPNVLPPELQISIENPQHVPMPVQAGSSEPSTGAGAAAGSTATGTSTGAATAATKVPAPASKTTPQAPAKPAAKTAIKALPTVRDHTTDQLNETGDEYLPRETDEFGEAKVMANGTLLGNRQYKCRTFLVPERGEKLFMLATECARVLGYRDSYLLFNKNRSLYKIIASQEEKDDLVSQDIIPFSYRSRQIAIVTARSMFRQFGSRVIVNGRRVRDDYWETKARKQGFTEADLAGDKRPGGAKARAEAESAAAAAAAAQQNNVMLPSHHHDIVYSNATPPFGTGPSSIVQGLADVRTRDYSAMIKGGPRQEITGPPYEDSARTSPLADMQQAEEQTAAYNRTINDQRAMGSSYMADMWRRPHEQPDPTPLAHPGTDATLPPPSRTSQSPHTGPGGMTHPGALPGHSPHLMMGPGPYAQQLPPHGAVGQPPMRTSTQPGAAPGPAAAAKYGAALPSSSAGASQQFSYPPPPTSQMWSPSSAHQQYSYAMSQSQPSQHSPALVSTRVPQPQESSSHSHQPAAHQEPQLRLPQMQQQQQQQPGDAFPGMPGMPAYGGQGLYDAQTPRGYMAPANPVPPAVTQGWSASSSQWWPNHPQ